MQVNKMLVETTKEKKINNNPVLLTQIISRWQKNADTKVV